MNPVHDPETIRGAVRQRYAQIASNDNATGAATAGCCGSAPTANPAPSREMPAGGQEGCCGHDAQARTLGYTEGDLNAVPVGSNLGLGCGNPVAIASLEPGQTVLDLGAGAGFDAFLAARAVGPTGHVIGVDMTPEMVTKARANGHKGGYAQVEFRLGEIEALPVADGTVDVILSNCVINLCPDKRPVYREAFRVLRAGGRIAVSDVVARRPLPDDVRADLALHSGCLAGATVVSELQVILEEAGFTDIVIRPKSNTNEVITSWDSKKGFEDDVFAAEVLAVKPAGDCCETTCCQ